METKLTNNLGYKIVIAIMIAIIGVMGYLMIKQKNHVATIDTVALEQNQEIGRQLDSLLSEHEKVKVSYGELNQTLIAKDSLIQAKAIEIKKLLGSQSELSVVKKKLAQLQKITSGYEKQIDSLYTVNRTLKNENEKIKTNYSLEQQKTFDLSKDKQELNERISEAAVLKAYKITAQAFNVRGVDKERATDKAYRTDKIKVCFTVGENKLVTKGNKRFFVRIAQPNNQILTRGPAYTFQFLGQTIQFSSMETLNYEGDAVDVCTYYEMLPNATELKKGLYFVNIFTEDREIGQTTFQLK